EAGAVYSQVLNTHSGKAYPNPSRAVSGRIFDALLSGNLMHSHAVLIRKEALEKAGYFDESLSSYEDWDLWLRISFHFPFVFALGLVGVYLVSAHGLWQGGEREKENTARVIAKALQMIPDSPRYALLKRTVRARTALEYSANWEEILVALRTYPFILHYSWARHRVSRWIRSSALRSESPLLTVQGFWAQMREAATSDPRVRSRRRIRQTVATSWAEIASSLAVRQARQREAAYAATRAVTLAPSLLVRGPSAPIIVRGVLASCVESARNFGKNIIRESMLASFLKTSGARLKPLDLPSSVTRASSCDLGKHSLSARPLVSVIIATRNRAALLGRALDSVFSQWGLGVEFDLDVIVVDDASTDSTATVVAEYPQLRYLRLSTQRGVSA